jgi:hypothetical protein
MVTSSSPKTTAIVNLLDAVRIDAEASTASTALSSPLLALFLTPSFANQVNLSALPLQFISRALQQDAFQAQSLDAIVAIVDRLPDANGSQFGHEGFTYAFLPNPKKAFRPSQTLLQTAAQKPGSINFNLVLDSAETTVQVPLSHTVFSTGMPSTLIHAHYSTRNATGQLQLEKETFLESETLPFTLGDMPPFVHYHTPLVPLTPARPVANSMGNIVRKLLPHSWQAAMHLTDLTRQADETQSLLPASEELERAVTKYFESMSIPPAAVQVWALIIPRLIGGEEISGQGAAGALLSLQEERIEASWKGVAPGGQEAHHSNKTSEAILSILKKGGRLCKVLSGGGGWGKKAGLVSLDPDLEYSTRELRGDSGWNFSFGEDEGGSGIIQQQREALGEMINEGDSIMFLLAPQMEESSSHDALSQVAEADISGAASAQIPTITFGPIPSTIDQIPSESSAAKVSGASTSSIRHMPHMFGILSEGGMAISRRSNDMWGVSETKSKLDVPFGTLTIRGSKKSAKGVS